MNKFNISEQDRKWFVKLKNKLWCIESYNQKDEEQGTLLENEWQMLLYLMGLYDLPCTLLKNEYNCKFIVFDHAPFMSVNPEILLSLTGYHIREAAWSSKYTDFGINRERHFLVEKTFPIVSTKRNIELLNFYTLEKPLKDKYKYRY